MRHAAVLIFVGSIIFTMGCNREKVEAPTEVPTQTDQGSQSLSPILFQDGELWGYQTNDGETVIPARFQMAQDFSAEGVAEVLDEKGWAIINREGKVLVRPFIFDNGPDPFQEGLARFVDGDKMGYFNASGEKVIAAQFHFAWPFEGGKARVCMDCVRENDGDHYRMTGGTQWFINQKGEKVESTDSE